MVNKALLTDAVQRALRSSDWSDLDTYFKDVIDGLEDFQTFYELLPTFLLELFGYEQAGILDSVESTETQRNTICRYLGPRSNFFLCLEKCSSTFTFFFPVSNLPSWLQKGLEEHSSPITSQNGLLSSNSNQDAFLAFCKARLRQTVDGELELRTSEYFLFCLVANTFWKRDLPVFEGDHSVTSKVFHPTLELKQLLSTRQGSGADQNQLFLKLERWLFLYFLYTYLVYLVPRKEVVCALDGTDIYLVKKYGEFFWQLFCNFYIFNEVSQISGPAALPSKFVFCVLTVAVSYIRSFYRISDHEVVHGESVLPSNKKEPKLFSTEDAWKSSDRSIIEFLHICSTLWSESLMSVDFMYLVCCIFVMVTPWMPLERWLNFPSSGGAVSWSTGSNGSSIQALTKTTLGVPRMQGLKETSNAVQDTFPLDWNEFICHYKDLYGALIPFIVRKAAILGVFKNSQFISLLKMLSNSFHCRSFEQEDSLLIIMRNAYDHITETYDQSLYSLSKANEFCPFSFFHQAIYRDVRNFQAETLKLLFDTWKQSKPYSRIGIVLQNDVTFATSASELRFPKEFLKEFRGLFLLLNVGPSSVSMATLVEDMPKSSNLFRRPFVTERSNINTERTGKTPTKGLVPGSLDKRAMKYRGDPWLAPVCSYECQPLVQLLYQTHLFLLRRFHMDLNFRFLASYIFLFYALTFCLLCIFLYFILR